MLRINKKSTFFYNLQDDDDDDDDIGCLLAHEPGMAK